MKIKKMWDNLDTSHKIELICGSVFTVGGLGICAFSNRRSNNIYEKHMDDKLELIKENHIEELKVIRDALHNK